MGQSNETKGKEWDSSKTASYLILNLKKIITDVDGTLTDGCHYFKSVEQKKPYAFKNFEPHVGDAFDIAEGLEIPVEVITSGKNGLPWSLRLGTHFPKRVKGTGFTTQRPVTYVNRRERRQLLKDQKELTLFLCDSYKDLEDVIAVKNKNILPIPSPVTDFRVAEGLKKVFEKNAIEFGFHEHNVIWGDMARFFRSTQNEAYNRAGFFHNVVYTLKTLAKGTKNN